MKRLALLTAAAAATVILAAAASPADNNVITKEGKTAVVNTTTLAKDVRGYHGATPVKIYIKGNKITKIETLPNHESPQYFARAKQLLAKYTGKSVKKAATMKVDAVTGATFSSKALIKNVQAGAKYYNEHK